MSNSAQGTTIAFTYDDWGRTVEKTMGSFTAEYGYRSALSDCLAYHSVESNYGLRWRP